MATEIVVWNIQDIYFLMKATDFEHRHQTFVHLAIVAAAFATYLFDRDDIVSRFVKDTSTPHLLERIAFFVATVLVVLAWQFAPERLSQADSFF